MKARIQELEAQLARERNSVNKESYYYNETVTIKHRTYILCINAEPYYKRHTERRFNQAKYDQDVAAANNRIRNLESEISSLKQQEAEQEILEAIEREKQQKITAEKARIEAIEQEKQQKIADEQARLDAIEQERLAEIEQARLEAIEKVRLEVIEKAKIATIREIQQVQWQINDSNSVSAICRAKIDAENRKTRGDQHKCSQVKHGNDIEIDKLSKQQKAIFDMLQSVDSKQRALYLSGIFGMPDSESVISMIKSLGFDANQLASYAIKKTNNELFDLALHYGANCCNYQIEGTTLLQQLVHSGNESFIKKVLAKGQDLTCTLVEAIGQNDVVTISKLSSYDSSLLSQKFVGYTLLQTAISAQKAQMVQKILQLDSSSAEVLTNNGESALKIAVRSGNDEIIKMVAQHTNLQIEIAQLGPKVEQALKDKILEYQDIETVIKLLRGEEMSLQQYLLTKQNHSRTTEEGVVTVGEEARLETMKQTKQQKQDCDDEQLVNSTSLQGVIHIESLESQFDEIHLIGNNNTD